MYKRCFPPDCTASLNQCSNPGGTCGGGGTCTSGQEKNCTTGESCPGKQYCSSSKQWGPCLDIADNCPPGPTAKPAPTSPPPTATPLPTATPTCNTGNCYNDCICRGNGSGECRAICPTPTSPPPTATPTQCRADGVCLGPGESCCGGRDYFDTACGVTETRCGIKSSPSVTPTPTPTISLSSPTPTPVPTKTPTPTPYCLRYYQEYCTYGCEATSTGGKCILTAPTTTQSPYALSPTPTTVFAIKNVGEACNQNSECESNNCQAAPGGKYCLPKGTSVSSARKEGESCALTAYNRVCETGFTCIANVCSKVSPTPTPKPLTPVQQIGLSFATAGLNLITSFNETGVAQHVQTQAQAISTDAQVIVQAINGEDLGADRWVNRGIAAYAALDILSRPLTLGTASLDDVRLAAMRWAEVNAEANARGDPIYDPARLSSAAQAGLKGTALVTSVAGVAGLTPNQAASELFANPTYQRLVGQYSQRAYTASSRLISRAESALGIDTEEAAFRRLSLYVEEQGEILSQRGITTRTVTAAEYAENPVDFANRVTNPAGYYNPGTSEITIIGQQDPYFKTLVQLHEQGHAARALAGENTTVWNYAGEVTQNPYATRLIGSSLEEVGNITSNTLPRLSNPGLQFLAESEREYLAYNTKVYLEGLRLAGSPPLPAGGIIIPNAPVMSELGRGIIIPNAPVRFGLRLVIPNSLEDGGVLFVPNQTGGWTQIAYPGGYEMLHYSDFVSLLPTEEVNILIP